MSVEGRAQTFLAQQPPSMKGLGQGLWRWISLTEVHLQLPVGYQLSGAKFNLFAKESNCKFHVEMEFQLEMTLQLLYPTAGLGQIQQDPHFLMDSWAPLFKVLYDKIGPLKD